MVATRGSMCVDIVCDVLSPNDNGLQRPRRGWLDQLDLSRALSQRGVFGKLLRESLDVRIQILAIEDEEVLRENRGTKREGQAVRCQ